MIQYVVVIEQESGGVFCLGIFDDYRTAIGEIMENIWDFKDSYKDEGDMFEMSDPYEMEGEGGSCITVKYKSKNWNKIHTDHYMMLYHTVEDEKKGE